MNKIFGVTSDQFWSGHAPRLGLAYAPSTYRIMKSNPGCIDFVEVPFELLEGNASIFERLRGSPIVLHSASLSLAGNLRARHGIEQRLAYWAQRSRTPWIGEHLAFTSAEVRGETGEASGSVVDIGFTVPPPMNGESVGAICERLRQLHGFISHPIALENSPLYFETPGTSMSQAQYINSVLDGSDAYLLLDLTHLFITCTNFAIDAAAMLDELCVERTIEVHLSGVESAEGVLWDNHASPIPRQVLELLQRVLHRCTPRAVTLEYNWISDFADDAVINQISTVRNLIDSRPCQTMV